MSTTHGLYYTLKKNVVVYGEFGKGGHNSSSHLPIFASKETFKFYGQLVPHTHFM
jgi:hypothetical protein